MKDVTLEAARKRAEMLLVLVHRSFKTRNSCLFIVYHETLQDTTTGKHYFEKSFGLWTFH